MQEFRKFFRERQAESGAFDLSLDSILNLRELFENRLPIFRSNSDACIFHGKSDCIGHLIECGRHTHFSRLCKLQGVGDKVPQDLRHFAFIRIDGRQVLRIFKDQVAGSAGK
jgi:hypothetical protein